jgi:hypothetical protein
MEDQQQQNNNSSLFQLNLDASNNYNLQSAALWAKVTGVVGIIIGLITAIVFIAAFIQASNQTPYNYNEGGADPVFGGLDKGRGIAIWSMVIMGIIFIVGGIFSFSFGNKIGTALKSNSQEMLNNGFTALRNYYALRGITLIVVLLLLLLTLVSIL